MRVPQNEMVFGDYNGWPLAMEQQDSAPARVQAALTAAGIDARIEEFPSSTRTAQEAAATVGTTVGQIVKSLVFLAGDSPVVALVSGVNRLDTQRLAALCGATIGKADADAVRHATGYSIGGVPPIGFPAPIPTFVPIAPELLVQCAARPA